MTIRFALVAASMALASVAGCGGDAEEAAPTSTTEATTTEATTTTSDPVPAPSTTLGPTEPPPTFTGEGGEQLCELGRELDLANAFRGSSGGGSIQAAYERVVSSLDEMAQVAPPEVAADVRAVAGGWASLRQPLEEAGWSIARIEPSVFEGPQVAELNAASRRLNAYLDQVCGIEPSQPGS